MKNLIDECCTDQWKDFLNFHIKTYVFDANQYIFKSKQPTLGLFLITEGKVKITRNDSDGNEKVIRLANDGEIVGHRGFAGEWNYPINAQCYTETTLKFIPIKALKTVMELNPKFTYSLMMFFAEELRISERFKDLITVKSRVAWALLKNLEVFPSQRKMGDLELTIPRKDIASFANTTYETVVRTLNEMNKEGLIDINKKEITLKDIDGLKELINTV